MSSFIVILICLVSGFLFRRFKILPENAAKTLNSFVLTLSLPALTIWKIHEVRIDPQMVFPVLVPWLSFGLSALIFGFLGRALKWSAGLTGCLVLTTGLGNTSFVGFPLLEALYGHESLGVGVMLDQAGSFLILSTLGSLTAARFASKMGSLHAPGLSASLLRVVRFPPFLALLAGFALRLVPFAPALGEALQTLGGTLVPLALISVGFQLGEKSARSAPLGHLALGLVFKLVISPAVISLFYLGVLGLKGRAVEIGLVESAMAPMITAAILADEAGLEPGLANRMVGIGIPISLLTVPAWAAILRHFV